MINTVVHFRQVLTFFVSFLSVLYLMTCKGSRYHVIYVTAICAFVGKLVLVVYSDIGCS